LQVGYIFAEGLGFDVAAAAVVTSQLRGSTVLVHFAHVLLRAHVFNCKELAVLLVADHYRLAPALSPGRPLCWSLTT
jgi:hypothetical protein